MCVPGTSGDDRDPYAWLRRFARVAPMVQLQQSDAEGDHHWPFTAQRNAEGRIDADRVLDALGEGGADDVALILEVIPPFEQADDEVADGPGRLGRLLAGRARAARPRRGVDAGDGPTDAHIAMSV